jgi:hypothetical protein
MEASQSPTPAPESGMWAPYEPPEIGEKLEVLEEAGAFVLVGVAVREGIKTEHGPRDAVDLTVQTGGEGTRLFSGFSAGIVGQAKRMADGDLPAVCRIVPVHVSRGTTRGLELVQSLAAGADLAAAAKAQRVPIMPVRKDDGIPY